MNPDLLAIVFGLVIGVSLGLTGGGGSIFAVPLLIYGLGTGVREAVGISLAAVGATSLFGAIMKAKSGSLEYGTGLIFAVAGMLGAPVGTLVGKRIPDMVTLSVFAVLMIVVGIRMWRSGPGESVSAGACRRDAKGVLRWTSPCLLVLIGTGFLVGVLSGIFGVGGGFIIVPALVMVSGMEIHRAVATSLMVIALVCLSGVMSYFLQGDGIPIGLTSLFLGGGFLGMLLGSIWAKRIAGPALKQVFAVSMWLVGIFVLVRNLVHFGS